MELNQLLEGSNNYKTLQADAQRLSGKWAKSGLLEGISNVNDRNNMAMILENQAKQIVSEASQTGNGAIGTATGGAEQWAGVALPLVRKVFAQISAKDFLSVQPMNLPSGLVFYLDFKYGTGEAGFPNNSNMYGNVSTANYKIPVDTEVSGGLYGAGRFGYSLNQYSASVGSLSKGTANSASIAYQDGINPSEFSTFTVALSSLSGSDAEAARGFRLISASVDVTTHPELTALNAAGTSVVFVVSGSILGAAAAINPAAVFYSVQPTDSSRGDFEDGSTKVPTTGTNAPTTINIPEINVTLASEAIVAKTRKLKAQWTPEFAQDLNAYHSIDAEAELTSLLSEYISMEIDLELIDMLIQDAATTEKWSARNNKVWTGTAWSSGTAASTDFYNTQGQWFQTIGTKIQKVSNKIHQKTLRGGANFLVCSPSVATILESIPGYAADTNGDKMDFAMGVQKVGQLNSRFRVYKNPYMTENIILMGYRGSQFLETGAVYAPYIPLMMTPLVYDPATFTPRKGIMTRYAKKMIRPEFYGKIFVSDVATI
jgi:hypothetical protein